LRGGERFDLGERALDVIHAPGHSPGGIVLLDRANGVLFSTDVAYPCALYAFGSQTDLAAYRRSMTLLADLAASLRAVYPSHCGSPMSPALLPAMRDALEAIAAGRPPDGVDGDRARHGCAGFSVLVPADGPSQGDGEG
jgi:glyoxylase-like metal-dependent hydrolase (beta-lactamase superfamily II)